MATEEKKDKPVEVQHPTLGEYRVGISFNPGGHETVNKLKAIAARFIDNCEAKKLDEARGEEKDFIKMCDELAGLATNPEAHRCFMLAKRDAANATASIANIAKAQADMEAAAMWSVKGATKPEKPAHL